MTSSVPLPYVPPPQGQEGGENGGNAGHTGAGRNAKDWRALRRSMIADLLIRGVPYRMMAAQLRCSKSTVAREVEKVREAWAERGAERYEVHVAESLAVLDRARGVAIGVMLAGGDQRLRACEVVARIEERRARLLGLDQPARVEVSTPADLEAKRERARELLNAVDELRERRARSNGGTAA